VCVESISKVTIRKLLAHRALGIKFWKVSNPPLNNMFSRNGNEMGKRGIQQEVLTTFIPQNINYDLIKLLFH
jgi:hypothetical protein